MITITISIPLPPPPPPLPLPQSLRLSYTSKDNAKVGHIINLMSNDVKIIDRVCTYVHTLTQLHIQINVYIYIYNCSFHISHNTVFC